MWLIVGLGNPGTRYLLTRHNVGFMALDYLKEALEITLPPKSEHDADTFAFKWDDQPIKMIKPLTYMNLSGEAVQKMASYYKIEPSQIIVVHDDLDQPFGQIRIKTGSGDGGHNGIKSITQCLGTKEYIRLKIGIGRPDGPMDPANYVLQRFSGAEQEQLPDVLNKSVDALEAIIFDGLTKALNAFNVRT